MSAFSVSGSEEYVRGYTDGVRYANSVNETFYARKLAKLICKPPCDLPSMDEGTIGDEWCSENCGNVTEYSCWKHAIEEGWLDDNL